MKRYSMAEDIYGTIVPKSTVSSARNVRSAASYGNLTDNGGTMDYRDSAATFIDKNGKVKRNKSFWRFSKSEEILEGMAMWRHRDLIPTEQDRYVEDQVREATLKRSSQQKNNKNKYEKSKMDLDKRSATLERSMNVPVVDTRSKYQLTKSEIDQRISKQNEIQKNDGGNNTLKKQGPPPKPERTVSEKNRNSLSNQYSNGVKVDNTRDREEGIYGDSSSLQRRTPASNNNVSQDNYRDTFDERAIKKDQKLWNGNKINDYYDQQDPDLTDDFDQADMSFYDDDSMQEVTMKSIKRRDILKQYYSSGTDTERNSTSSDPYDCIVVEDHLVSAAELARKNKKNRKGEEKMEFSTFKSNKTDTSRIEQQQQTRNSGSMLPRTKLSKSSGHKSDSQSKYESGHESNRETVTKKRTKSSSKQQQQQQQHPSSQYSGWVDLWGNEGTLKK